MGTHTRTRTRTALYTPGVQHGRLTWLGAAARFLLSFVGAMHATDHTALPVYMHMHVRAPSVTPSCMYVPPRRANRSTYMEAGTSSSSGKSSRKQRTPVMPIPPPDCSVASLAMHKHALENVLEFEPGTWKSLARQSYHTIPITYYIKMTQHLDSR